MKIQLAEVTDPVEWRKVLRREMHTRSMTQVDVAAICDTSNRVVHAWVKGLHVPRLYSRAGILWFIRRHGNDVPHTPHQSDI